MLNRTPPKKISSTLLLLGIAGIALGLTFGFLAGMAPIYLGGFILGVAGAIFFFTRFEQAVLGLIIIRSSLDVFSDFQIPSVLGLSTILLSLAYLLVAVLTRRQVCTDGFWWFFLAWMMLQGVWLLLMPLGVLGFDTSLFAESLYEWLRLFTWVIIYLLVMQLQKRIPAERLLNLLFFSLCFPLLIAAMQLFTPFLLPSIFTDVVNDLTLAEASGTRIHATFAHPNSFATYLIIFIGLTWWKLNQSRKRLPWAALMGALVFVLISTKTIFILAVLGLTVFIVLIPKLNLARLISAILLLTIVFGLFASTEFGQQRLLSISKTPLLNSHIDSSRAILLSQGDFNSFNWRIAQWDRLTKAWQEYPVLGYGVGLSYELGDRKLLPHNDYLRAMVEEGVVGLVLFVGFLVAQILWLVWLIRHRPGNKSQQELRFILLSLSLSIPLGMCTDNLWSQTAAYFYWWSLFSVVGWEWETNPRELALNPACDGRTQMPRLE